MGRVMPFSLAMTTSSTLQPVASGGPPGWSKQVRGETVPLRQWVVFLYKFEAGAGSSRFDGWKKRISLTFLTQESWEVYPINHIIWCNDIMCGDVFCWDRIISSGSGRDAELCTLEGPWFWWFSERFLLVLTTIPDTPPRAVANIMTPSIVVLHHWRRDCSAVSPSHEISTFGDGDRILTSLHIYI
jgi:hypothetical protein